MNESAASGFLLNLFTPKHSNPLTLPVLPALQPGMIEVPTTSETFDWAGSTAAPQSST